MPQFNQEDFNKFVLENKVIGLFDKPVILKSGRKSHWYANWRTVTSDTFLTDQLSDFLLNFVADLDLKFAGFFGVPEGATKVALISNFKWARTQPGYAKHSHWLAMGRGKPKEHGAAQDKYFLGLPKGQVIVVEDVTTTGGSLIKTINQLKEIGVQVVAAIGIFNRLEVDDQKISVAKLVKEAGADYYAMSEAASLLPKLCTRAKPSLEIIDAIEKEFIDFGVEPLKLR
ncbi:MAG: hypothetical protein ABH859_00685 [Pseudomonadota bacterium]